MAVIIKKPGGQDTAAQKNSVKAVQIRSPGVQAVDTDSIRKKFDYPLATAAQQAEVKKWMGLPDPPKNPNTLASTSLDREVVFGSLYTQEGMSGALRPPYEPDRLAELVETNNTLQACIDAMVTNVDGTGYEVIASETEDQEIPDSLAEALKNFFDQPFPGTTFMSLRKRLRRDLETTGNAYIEVIRNLEGKIALVRRMDPCITRIMRLGNDTFDEEIWSPLLQTDIMVQVRRRRYVQYVFGKLVYFREFGSPMELNRFTGIWEDGRGSDYAGSQGGQGSNQPGVAIGDRASEVLHLVCMPHPIYPYGIPRWIHQIPSVLGSRRAEEWNLGFFEQGGIPPMLIVIQGGEAADNVEEAIKNLFYSAGPQKTTAAVLQVQSTSGDLNDPGAVKVTVERFGQDRQKDQMFSNYDTNCYNKVRRAFRLPPMFVGDAESHNYACYDECTETLTDHGWVKWGGFKPGMKIACFDPKTKQAVYHEPEGQAPLVYDVADLPMYHFKTDTVDVCVTPKHRMYYGVSMGDWRLAPVEELIDSPSGDVLFIAYDGPYAFHVGVNVKRDLSRQNYTGKVYCFSVPTGIFITRRNGKVSVQGNTALASYRVAEAQVFAPERLQFDEVITTTLLKDIMKGTQPDSEALSVKFRSLPITAKDMDNQMKAILGVLQYGPTAFGSMPITPEEFIDNINEVTGLVLNAATPEERNQMMQEKALNAAMFGNPQPGIEEGSGAQLESAGGMNSAAGGVEEAVGKRETPRKIIVKRPARKFDIRDGEQQEGDEEDAEAERMTEIVRKGHTNGFDSVEFLSRSPEHRDRVSRKVARRLFCCSGHIEEEAAGRAAEAMLYALRD